MKPSYLILIAAITLASLSVRAAQVDDPAPPTSPLSAMFSLEDIYNRLNTGAAGAKRTGGFVDPTTGPIATRHTLNDVMAMAPASDNTNGSSSANVLSGKTYWSLLDAAWGQKSGTMPNNGGVNIVPSSVNQPIPLGYHDGTGNVIGSANLISANIRAGINIFGVIGNPSVVDTGDATATANDVISGKTAYVNGSLVIGALPPIPTDFSGPLLGDVTGIQTATVVSFVGGVTGANVASGANAANAATDLNTASTIVKRDPSGNFNAGAITLAGKIDIPSTSSSTVGVITQGGGSLIHTFGAGLNFFAGANAGNFTTTGSSNTATGAFALSANTTGGENTAFGVQALQATNTGGFNTANGYQSLASNTTGSSNSAYGMFSLLFNTTGSNNIAVGYNAGGSLTTGNNNIDIGHSGVAAESNIIRIGTSQTDTFLTGIIHGNGSALTNVGATTFSGSLTGDVTGTQAATVVSTVGGVTAANVASGANAANAATNLNTASTIVKRDASGNFSAGTITAVGNLGLPTTTDASAGVITQNGSQLIHTFGTNNFFAGTGAGNFTTGGSQCTAVGAGALTSNTNGSSSAFGYLALANNTTGNGNAAFSNQALRNNTLGALNTAMGSLALFNNTTGNNNCALGQNALLNNTTGSANIGIGDAAGMNLTTGSGNIDIGHVGVAAESNKIRIGTAQTDTFLTGIIHGNTFDIPTTASAIVGVITQNNGTRLMHTAGSNLFVGRNAGNFSVTGTNDVGVGAASLSSITSGTANTAIGESTLILTTTGFGNTAGGYQALFNNTSGGSNVAIGLFSLINNTTGSGNIALGSSAGNNLTTGNSNIDIGNVGVAAEANTIRIGTTGNQTSTFIAGISGVTVSGGAAVSILANGQLGTITSSRRFKDNIQPMNNASESLLKLNPVTFTYKKELDAKNIPQWGLIAEEVAAINPDLVVLDEKGEINTVRYEQINAMLLNEFLKEHKKVEEQNQKISTLEERLARMEKALEALSTPVTKTAPEQK